MSFLVSTHFLPSLINLVGRQGLRDKDTLLIESIKTDCQNLNLQKSEIHHKAVIGVIYQSIDCYGAESAEDP